MMPSTAAKDTVLAGASSMPPFPAWHAPHSGEPSPLHASPMPGAAPGFVNGPPRPRLVEGALGRLGPGRIAPFTAIPIRWELAFGGMSFLQNPLGRGMEPIPDDEGR